MASKRVPQTIDEYDTHIAINASIEIIEPAYIIVIPDSLRDAGFTNGEVVYQFSVNDNNAISNVYVSFLILNGADGEYLYFGSVNCKIFDIEACPPEIIKYMPILFSSFYKIQFRVENRERFDVIMTLKIKIL